MGSKRESLQKTLSTMYSEEANDAYRFCLNFVVHGVEQKNLRGKFSVPNTAFPFRVGRWVVPQ